MAALATFTEQFVLPLVKGGFVEVSRPLGPRAYAKLLAQVQHVSSAGALVPLTGRSVAQRDGAAAFDELAQARARAGAALTPLFEAPPLDEPALRLLVALHNLLALGHPAMPTGPTAREETITFSQELARLGPPRNPREAIERYTLSARMVDLQRTEHEVRHWLGTQTFVGREPPRRLLLWPTLRRVQVAQQQRSWLRDIGIPTEARGLWEVFNDANPLIEAMDPTRLDPPVSWRRLLEVLQFETLARSVAAHLVGQGLAHVGEPLALALFGHSSLRTVGARPSGGETIAFALQFLAHLYWMHALVQAPGEPGPALAALLSEAALHPELIAPRDVAESGLYWAGTLPARMTSLRQRVRLSHQYLEEARATVAQAQLALRAGLLEEHRADRL